MLWKVLLYSLVLALIACKQSSEEKHNLEQLGSLGRQLQYNKTWQYQKVVSTKNQQETWSVYDQAAAYAQTSAQLIIRRDETQKMWVEIVAHNVTFRCDRDYCPIRVSFSGKSYLFYLDTHLSTESTQNRIVFALDGVDVFLAQLRQADMIEVTADFFPMTETRFIFNTQLAEQMYSY